MREKTRGTFSYADFVSKNIYPFTDIKLDITVHPLCDEDEQYVLPCHLRLLILFHVLLV